MGPQHLERSDLLEAACDLLWSLAFNNPLLKEVIGQQGGIPIIIRGMKMHPGSTDFLKSACGALSNMCQNAQNQTLIATHGGIFCMVQVSESGINRQTQRYQHQISTPNTLHPSPNTQISTPNNQQPTTNNQQPTTNT